MPESKVWPDRHMTAEVAAAGLKNFIAGVSSKMGFISERYKPAIVRTDKGSAFISHHFREFTANRQIHLTYSAEYIHPSTRTGKNCSFAYPNTSTPDSLTESSISSGMELPEPDRRFFQSGVRKLHIPPYTNYRTNT